MKIGINAFMRSRWAVASTVMALTTVFPTPLLAGLSFFLLGAGPILWVISTTTLRQSVTPPRLLGRVSAINIMSYGARPLGSALGAIVGGFYSAEACLYLAAAVFGVLTPLIVADIAFGSGHFNLAQGVVGTATGIGASLSNVLAGYVSDHLGHNIAFLGLSSIGCLGLCLIALVMPETKSIRRA